MAVQQRAARTKQVILRAAAAEFDDEGYERTSLSRIGSRAQVTTGAVVFHFTSKAALAEAVRQRSRTVTRKAVETTSSEASGPVHRLVAVTRTIIGLFETDEVVRAGERLSRELKPQENAHEECPWRREVARLSRAVASEGMLRPGTDATALAALVSYVVSGVELAMRRAPLPVDEPWLGEAGSLDGAAQLRLERIWDLLLPILG
ncbi:TetR family transcriptional regulator [Streptomyces sp. CA-243310]|uniref:TetR family transcriptional regulator n=1 Tax=Streptomyces sp. CA-243310 TaxID=3240056 RepID=UPI003D8B466C